MATLVTGATGRIGGATLRALVAAGHEPIAMVRARERTAALPCAVETRVADMADPEALADAFTGVDALLLCSGHEPTMGDLQRNAISAATDAGIRRIVKISASPASVFPDTPSRVAAQHLALEAALAETGIECTNVRPNAFAQLIGGFAHSVAEGELPLPLGDAAISWVDTRDVGAVAAAALRTDGPLPPRIEVTGPDALTGDAVARLLSEHTGHRVAYRPLSDAENRERLRAGGAPEWLVEHVVVIFSLLRERDGDRVTDGVQRWLGRPATPVADVLTRDGPWLGIGSAAAASPTGERR